MIQLHLYSTSHCHLCEQAETLLTTIAEQYDINWMPIEIADDSKLLENYGLRIPVIKRLNDNTEIAWPFTAQEIEKLITT